MGAALIHTIHLLHWLWDCQSRTELGSENICMTSVPNVAALNESWMMVFSVRTAHGDVSALLDQVLQGEWPHCQLHLVRELPSSPPRMCGGLPRWCRNCVICHVLDSTGGQGLKALPQSSPHNAPIVWNLLNISWAQREQPMQWSPGSRMLPLLPLLFD